MAANPSSAAVLPALIGVVHLQPLPGSPDYGGALAQVAARAAADARALAAAGFDGLIVENFGDAPFVPTEVPPVTVAAMTRCVLSASDAAPDLALGINVLRNDARAAIAVAAACNAAMVRVNVHVGARLTDQGIIEGRAHETLRLRRALELHRGPAKVALLCDVAVKHSAALSSRSITEEAEEAAQRGCADALLVTGSTTGRPADATELEEVLAAVEVPVFVASGVTRDTLPGLLRARAGRRVYGVIVGSSLRQSGRAGDPIDPTLAATFAEGFRAAR